MKTLTLIALLLTSTVWAETTEEVEFATVEETCKVISDLATIAMQHRQSGMPLAVALDGVDEKFFREVLLEAYGKPAYSTKAMQKKMVSEFSSTYMLACYKNKLRLPK